MVIKSKFINQMEPWIDKEEKNAVVMYLDSGGWLTEFKKTYEFEQMIADFVGSKYACVVTNGTVTLYIALAALGIGLGDEVLVPDFTMIASANSVILAGAKPILIDINPNNLCVDLSLAQKAINKRTKALMYVSLDGRCGDMDEIVEFCKKHKLYLIEDAAQSLGSLWRGKHLGTFGEIGSFSFSQHKVITTGQGGALVTDSSKLIDKIRKIKDFGRSKPGVDEHITLGYNFKFTDLQAVIGIEQMKKLDYRVKRKKDMFQLYQKELSLVKEISFVETNLEDTSPWFIDILVKKRKKALIEYLRNSDIGTRPFYPPIHTQVPYSKLKSRASDFQVSSEISTQGLWLPSSPFLKDITIKNICARIKNFYKV